MPLNNNPVTAGGMEIDAFVVRGARVSALKEMGVLLFLSTRLPSGMTDVDFDIALCGGWGVIVVCKVPQGKTVKDFVHEICFLVSIRCVIVMQNIALFKVHNAADASAACGLSHDILILCTPVAKYSSNACPLTDVLLQMQGSLSTPRFSARWQEEGFRLSSVP